MTIIVGSDIPGLLGELEQKLGGSQCLTVVREAATILAMVMDTDKRIEALILGDNIAPTPGKDVATSLWDITSYVTRSRQPCVPTVVTLSSDTPVAIYEALQAEVRQTGGDAFLLPRTIRTANQPETRQVVEWITGQLHLASQRRQYIMAGVNQVGGVGQTTTLLYLCAQLVRLGLRVLLVDVADMQALVARASTIPVSEEQEQVSCVFGQQLAHHQSGLDRAQMAPEQLEDATDNCQTFILALPELEYDVICFDLPRNWQHRAFFSTLLAQPNTSPLVVCSPGMKERTAAKSTLAALGAIKCSNNQSALDRTMLVFLEGERGQTKRIREVREDVLGQFPSVTDLGTLPRDPALISMAAEQPDFISPFDLAPKRPYCHALRRVARQWIEAVEVPVTWLTRYDPDERRERQPFWSLRRGQKPKQSRPPQIEHHEQNLSLPLPVPADLPANNGADTQARTLPLPADVAEPVAPGTAPWLDEALHLNRIRTRRSVAAFEQQE